MKIRTKLLISNVLSLGIVLLVGAILSWTFGQFNQSLERSKAINEVTQGIFELKLLTSDYLLHHEQRAQRQWHLKHDSLTRLLGRVEYKDPEQRKILDRINQNHESIKTLFSQLVSNYERREDSEAEGSVYRELEERIVGQLLVKLQDMVSSAFQLNEASTREAVTVGMRARFLVLVFFLVLAVFMTTTSFLIRRSITRPITALHEGTEIIGEGNLDYKVGTPAKDEIGQLSRAFDQMTDNIQKITASRDELNKEITERKRVEEELQKANERMGRDLEAAAEIQKSLLPTVPPAVGAVNFAWLFKPSEKLGGDMLNVFLLDENHVALYILDVSGHGVTAALLSVTLSRVLSPIQGQSSIILKQQAEGSRGHQVVPPAEVAERLNKQFPMDLSTQQFFTLLYGILDLRTHEFRYVSAGHPYPVYLPWEGKPTIPEEHRLDSAIGFPHESKYQEHSFVMKPGDRLYLYSDGILEASNADGEEFGKKQFTRAFDQSRSVPLAEGLSSLLKNVERWLNGSGVGDDVSILAFEINR